MLAGMNHSFLKAPFLKPSSKLLGTMHIISIYLQMSYTKIFRQTNPCKQNVVDGHGACATAASFRAKKRFGEMRLFASTFCFQLPTMASC